MNMLPWIIGGGVALLTICVGVIIREAKAAPLKGDDYDRR